MNRDYRGNSNIHQCLKKEMYLDKIAFKEREISNTKNEHINAYTYVTNESSIARYTVTNISIDLVRTVSE